LLAAVTQSAMLAAFFSTRPFAFLGRISFLVYLLHLPVICSLTSWMVFPLYRLPYWANASVSALATVAAVVALATVGWRPADHLPTRLSKRAGTLVDALMRRLSARVRPAR
jgi:peptidoglycan/LPS O-acetylase OafA/YrhL